MIKIFTCFLAILLCSTMVFPQRGKNFVFEEKKPVDDFFFVNSGASTPTSPQRFSSFWNGGFNIGFGFGKRLNPNSSLTVAIDFNRFQLDERAVADVLAIADSENQYSGGLGTTISATINFKSNIRRPQMQLRPYVYGGGGFIRGSTGKILINENTDTEIEISGNALTSMALGFGGGIDYRISTKRLVFVELRYVMGIEEAAAQYLGLKFGLTLG